jgi:hypothetical protein
MLSESEVGQKKRDARTRGFDLIPKCSGTLGSGRLLSSLPPFGGERGSLKGHEMGFHARQSDYLLFSNKLFASIATRYDLVGSKTI